MYKLEFTLRQHTPLIHFQHHQEGATLRATEVKSRLNRLVKNLIENFANPLSHNEKELLKKYWIEEKTKNGEVLKEYLSGFKIQIIASHPVKERLFWCNYTPKVNSSNREERKLLQKEMKHRFKVALGNDINWQEYEKVSFFSNNAILNDEVKKGEEPEIVATKIDSSDYKLGVKHNNINIEIFSFDKSLRELIIKILPSVFFQYNFGTRQTKGFGCFLHDKFNESSITQYFFHSEIKSIFIINEPIKTNTVLSKIQEIYLKLKGGQRELNGNIGNNRLISQFFYNKTPRIAWEKPRIKQNLRKNLPAIWRDVKQDKSPSTLSFPNDDTSISNFKYVRALLGLAELYEYQSNRGNPIKIEIEDHNKDKNTNIQRFASPLTFKYDGSHLYIIVWEIPISLLNGEFDFKLGSTVLATLNIPQEPDLTKFVNYALNRLYPNKYSKIK